MEQCPHPHRLARTRRRSARRRTPELAHVGHCTPSRTASRPTWAAAGSLCKIAYQDETQLSHHPLAVTGRVALSPRTPLGGGVAVLLLRLLLLLLHTLSTGRSVATTDSRHFGIGAGILLI